MSNGQGSQPPARAFAEMVPLSFAAALVFFSMFWGFRHPGTPEFFSAVAAFFALPQLLFPATWRTLRSPWVLIVSGGLIALSCAIGSLFPAPYAQFYVYSAPWFLVICWYFTLGCLASGLIFMRHNRLVLGALHLSFVLIACGFALDGYFGIEGEFRTTLKTAPGVMPPAYGHFAPGESSDTLITGKNDPGTALPFTLKLVSFTVDFETLVQAELRPGQKVYFGDKIVPSPDGKASGGAQPGKNYFRILGYDIGQADKPALEIETKDLDSALIVIEVVMKGVRRTALVPFDGGSFGPFTATVSYDADPGGGKVTNLAVNVVQKAPKRYCSVVDIIVDGETVLKEATIEVNKPLRFEGWSIYQADWGRYVSLDEWESLPGNMRTEKQFEAYLAKNEIPPTSMFTISRTPGKWVVYLGYIMMCVFSLAMLALPRTHGNGGER